ncbi:hypothetical protein LJ739_06990 [Aestuariibacter halophilus]|uniref:Uncharacterized protein n=1 Tax=Fluctibacter halophilus TaxID=226011 RepID=A0ABS8G652_9ALTE|nr:hypothetical protein [Aestuariibacter halophilus]MCC2615983.1 hypothetical protein [Aestuariibacter halophilus]
MTTINEQQYQRYCAVVGGAPTDAFGAGKASGDYYGKFATHENGILTRFWAVWDGESWQACDECEEDVTLLSDIKTHIAMYEENQRLRESNAKLRDRIDKALEHLYADSDESAYNATCALEAS